MEFGLLAQAAIGVGCAWLALAVLDREGEVGEAAPDAGDRLLVAGLVGVAVGRLWAMVVAGTNPLVHPLDIPIIRGGVDTLGASLGALATLVWAYRDRLPAATDALAAPIAFGLAGWHGGCVVRGACLGTASDLPWAVAGRHPVEGLAALGLAAVAVVVAVAWRRAGPGWATAGAVTGVAAVRLATEPLRLHLGDGRVGLYTLGVVAGLVLAGAVARAGRVTG